MDHTRPCEWVTINTITYYGKLINVNFAAGTTITAVWENESPSDWSDLRTQQLYWINDCIIGLEMSHWSDKLLFAFHKPQIIFSVYSSRNMSLLSDIRKCLASWSSLILSCFVSCKKNIQHSIQTWSKFSSIKAPVAISLPFNCQEWLGIIHCTKAVHAWAEVQRLAFAPLHLFALKHT